jgi:hypothetical protein
MIISRLDLHETGRLVRVSAGVSYEDNDTPVFELFAETEGTFRHAFQPDPNGILLACLLPAWRLGEKRIFVHGNLDPILVRDVRAALRVLATWYPELGPWPLIESSGSEVRQPKQGPSVSLLSCGIDSLATLRQNTTCLPLGHPLRIGASIPIVFCNSPGKGNYDDRRLVLAKNVTGDVSVDLDGQTCGGSRTMGSSSI